MIKTGREPGLSAGSNITGREPELSGSRETALGRMPARSYGEALAYLGKKNDRPYHGERTKWRGGTYRTSPRATRVARRDGGVAVKYHDTDVVTYTSEGLVLNTDGYRTSTTKARINEALGVLPGRPNIYQRNRRWYVVGDFLAGPVSFQDGMVIGWDGSLVTYNSDRAHDEAIHTNILERQLKRYTDTLRTKLDARTLHAPDNGDCWVCLASLSTDVKNPDHIRSHLEETYIVPSLVALAVRLYGSQYDMWVLGEVFAESDGERDPSRRGLYSKHHRESIVRAVRKYIRVQLGLVP